MSTLTFNLQTLLQNPEMVQVFNEAAESTESGLFSYTESDSVTYNGVLANTSIDSEIESGIWDADIRLDKDTVIITGWENASGGGRLIEAHFNANHELIKIVSPNPDDDTTKFNNLTLESIFVEPRTDADMKLLKDTFQTAVTAE